MNSIQDVNDFLDYCLAYIGIGFHPDTPFEDYVDIRTNEPLFSDETTLNALMARAFDICSDNGIDIYELTFSKL